MGFEPKCKPKAKYDYITAHSVWNKAKNDKRYDTCSTKLSYSSNWKFMIAEETGLEPVTTALKVRS